MIAIILVNIVLRRTVLGRHIYSVGGNDETSRLSGIRVDFVKIITFVMSSILAAISGIILTARVGTATATAGSGYELDAIASVALGGTSMNGGKGSIVGTVLGMLIIAVMNNMLNLIGVPPFLREAFKGLIVIVAVPASVRAPVSVIAVMLWFGASPSSSAVFVIV